MSARAAVKGFYGRARHGEIAGFTGIDDLFSGAGESRTSINTREVTVEQAADLVMSVTESPATLDTIRPIDEGLSLQEL